MPMLIEGNGCDAAMMHTGLVGIPGIEGGISGDMRGEEAKHRHHLPIEGEKIGDIVLVERLGIFSKDDIPVASGESGDDAGAIAPEVLFADGRRAIGVLLVGTLFDAHFAVGIALWLAIFTKAVEHGLAWV